MTDSSQPDMTMDFPYGAQPDISKVPLLLQEKEKHVF